MKTNLAKKKINWDEYIIPQINGKDVKIFQEILKDEYGYKPIDHSDMEYHLLDGKVGIKLPGNMGTLRSADMDESSIGLIDEVLSTWPEMRVMVSEMMDYFYPAVMNDGTYTKGQKIIGCSCGIYGNAPHHERTNPNRNKKENESYDISILSTVAGAVGCVEGIVHELGHQKLHALWIDLEDWTGQLFKNGKDEVFHSPVRFDKKRPIAAVVQAEFSYVYVTEFYTHFLQWMLDNNMNTYEGMNIKVYGDRQAYNLKRIGNGIHTIKKVAKLTKEGKRFMKSFMNYSEDVWRRGYLNLSEVGNIDDFDYMPVEGIPVEIK